MTSHDRQTTTAAFGRMNSRRATRAVLLSTLSIAMATAMIAASDAAPSARRGKAFARANCAQCHAIDKVSRSRLPTAPPFRTLHTRYPVETLDDALAEGLSTGHPSMPEFRLDPGQVGDFIAFLKSLER